MKDDSCMQTRHHARLFFYLFFRTASFLRSATSSLKLILLHFLGLFIINTVDAETTRITIENLFSTVFKHWNNEGTRANTISLHLCLPQC